MSSAWNEALGERAFYEAVLKGFLIPGYEGEEGLDKLTETAVEIYCFAKLVSRKSSLEKRIGTDKVEAKLLAWVTGTQTFNDQLKDKISSIEKEIEGLDDHVKTGEAQTMLMIGPAI